MIRVFLLYVFCSVCCEAFTLPAGLRPAKAFGQHTDGIVPGKVTTELPLKEPANLSLRSRMLAAMSASSKESDNDIKTTTSAEPKTQSPSTETPTIPPLILTKSNKKSAAAVGGSKPNALNSPSKYEVLPITGLDHKKANGVNFGLNTVLHTNLVDSKGRIMKGVNAVPIKVSTPSEMKAVQTRHSASQVESEAENVVPIKFGSS